MTTIHAPCTNLVRMKMLSTRAVATAPIPLMMIVLV